MTLLVIMPDNLYRELELRFIYLKIEMFAFLIVVFYYTILCWKKMHIEQVFLTLQFVNVVMTENLQNTICYIVPDIMKLEVNREMLLIIY